MHLALEGSTTRVELPSSQAELARAQAGTVCRRAAESNVSRTQPAQPAGTRPRLYSAYKKALMGFRDSARITINTGHCKARRRNGARSVKVVRWFMVLVAPYDGMYV